MNFEITFEKHLRHPLERVWEAVTDPALLAEWLMPNDLETVEAGRTFRLFCEDEESGHEEYHCRILEVDPPRRIVWSWVLEGSQHLGETRVEISLEEADGGTRLQLTHSGDRDREVVDRFRSGWPWKLDRLADALI